MVLGSHSSSEVVAARAQRGYSIDECLVRRTEILTSSGCLDRVSQTRGPSLSGRLIHDFPLETCWMCVHAWYRSCASTL